ncbi:MAG: copper amine oxidase N-terminal domain-containing protein [Armatimonadetes bacterium]|nr:copper amine oxidase N-terminal domain-containing protein [Armatimonadota bacterium]
MTVCLAVVTTLISAVGASARDTYDVNLPAGTVIPVVLDQELGSGSSHKGQQFSATVKTDGESTYSGLPEGTQVQGHVTVAQPKEGDNPGVLDLSFDDIRFPDGSTYRVDGSLYSLDAKSVKRDENGRLVAKTSGKKSKMTYVGYGAGAGLLMALLSNHSTSKVLQDVIIGAGLGYLAAGLDKSDRKPHDVKLDSGSEFGVRLESRFATNTVSGHSPGRSASHASQSTTVTQAVYQREDSTPVVMIGDQAVEFGSQKPVVNKGVMMVPVADVLRAADVPFAYMSGKSGIVTRGDSGRAQLKVGSRVVILDGGKRVRLDAPAQKMAGELYVPLRFLEVVTNRKLIWDAATKTAILEDASDSESNSGQPSPSST